MKKHQPPNSRLPKGAYRLPTGGYVTESRGLVGKRMITIRAVHKDPPDYEKLARALLMLVEDMANKENDVTV